MQYFPTQSLTRLLLESVQFSVFTSVANHTSPQWPNTKPTGLCCFLRILIQTFFVLLSMWVIGPTIFTFYTHGKTTILGLLRHFHEPISFNTQQVMQRHSHKVCFRNVFPSFSYIPPTADVLTSTQHMTCRSCSSRFEEIIHCVHYSCFAAPSNPIYLSQYKTANKHAERTSHPWRHGVVSDVSPPR